jgi:mono/diheme cytochrome c family protein
VNRGFLCARGPSKSIVTGAFLAAFVVSSAFAAGDAQAGRDLARVWCSGCHLVDPSTHGQDSAPPFQTIARRHSQDSEWVHLWLSAPHPPMPNFGLSERQISDIVAYLASLTRR